MTVLHWQWFLMGVPAGRVVALLDYYGHDVAAAIFMLFWFCFCLYDTWGRHH